MTAWIKTIFEGGFWALLAMIIPYPRLAFREGALRAQYVCKLMDYSVKNCINGFKYGRDDRLISRGKLLIEQANLNLNQLRNLKTPCYLESLLLFLGQAGVLMPLQALEILTKNMTARLECIEGMQKAMNDLKFDEEQKIFADFLSTNLISMEALTSKMLNDTEKLMNFKSLMRALFFRSNDSLINEIDFESYVAKNEQMIAELMDNFQSARLTVYQGCNSKTCYLGEKQEERKLTEEVHKKMTFYRHHQHMKPAFARGSFIFSFITLSTMLSRLQEARKALKIENPTSRLILAASAMSIIFYDFLSYGPKFNLSIMQGNKIKGKLQELFKVKNFCTERKSCHRDLVHPLKVSLIIFVCSLFVLVKPLKDVVQVGAWITVTACFIISDTSSSAAITSNLRLIGSVVGAMYGWLVTAIAIETNKSDQISIRNYSAYCLPPWIAICCFFRNSKSHGYSAVTSSFTAVVIILGTFSSTIEGVASPLIRIQNTLIGVVIYMLLDNLLCPVRSRSILLVHIEETLKQFKNVASNLEAGFLKSKISTLEEDEGNTKTTQMESNEVNEEEDNKLKNEWLDAIDRGEMGLIDWRIGTKRKNLLPPMELGNLVPVRDRLEQQKKLIDMCYFEPTLWHMPFHGESYQEILSSEREVLSNLIQLERSGHSFSAICTAYTWNIEAQKVSRVIYQAHVLLKLIKRSLHDAQKIFTCSHGNNSIEVADLRASKAQHVLELQKQADILKETIEVEMMAYILDKQGIEGQISLQFSLRFNSTIFHTVNLQASIEKLGYAITAVIEREKLIFYYT